MVWKKHDYEDIPGTYVFDGKRAHGSYPINKLLFSLNDADNRAQFDADPDAYCDRYEVHGEVRDALLSADLLKLLQCGANIYYMAKLALPRGISIQDVGAAFQGVSSDEFKQALLARGEGLEEKLAARGGYWHG
jgi:protocatechuate 4,5-dioxygenase alpha chain